MYTKTLIVPSSVLEDMLKQWLKDEGWRNAQWRRPKCWGCGRKLWFRMWHVFFREGQREAHLCRRCGKPFEFWTWRR